MSVFTYQSTLTDFPCCHSGSNESLLDAYWAPVDSILVEGVRAVEAQVDDHLVSDTFERRTAVNMVIRLVDGKRKTGDFEQGRSITTVEIPPETLSRSQAKG